jgi:hypothetical protein
MKQADSVFLALSIERRKLGLEWWKLQHQSRHDKHNMKNKVDWIEVV